ncbi:hypothetical protein ES702_05894 [subsurface metagenome]
MQDNPDYSLYPPELKEAIKSGEYVLDQEIFDTFGIRVYHPVNKPIEFNKSLCHFLKSLTEILKDKGLLK